MDNKNHTRRAAISAIKLIVTALVIAFIVRYLGISKIVESLTNADPWWIALACASFIVSGILGVWQWRVLLKIRGITISRWRSTVLYFAGMFLNNFTLGAIAGDALKITSIKFENGKGTEGFAATFLDRFAGLLAMSGFAVLGSIVLLNNGLVHGGRLITALIALFSTFFLFGGVLAFLTSQRLQFRLLGFVDRHTFPFKKSLQSLLLKTIIETHERHVVAPVAILSTLIQSLRIGVHIMCAASLGIVSAQNIQYFLIFVPMIAIIMMAPLPFGIRETLGGSLFLFAGVGHGNTTLPIVMQFLASLVGIACSLPAAIIFILGKRTCAEKKP